VFANLLFIDNSKSLYEDDKHQVFFTNYLILTYLLTLNNVHSWIKKTLDNIMVYWITNSVELLESCKLWNILGTPSRWLNLILNA